VARVRLAAPLLCGAVILCSLTGCQEPLGAGQDAMPRITIGAATFPASAPVYVAEKKGFFADEGLDAQVRVYDAGISALEDVISGQVDFAMVAETPIARAALEGKPFNVMMTLAEMDSANYIVADRDKGILTAGDLKGKRVGFAPGTTGDFFLHIFLAASRIPASAIEEVPLKPNETASAVLSDTVDAVSTWPPHTIHVEERLGSRAVVLDEPGLYTMSWNLVAGEGSQAPDATTSARLVRALKRAEDYMAEHPRESIAITAERCQMKPKDLQALWDGFEWRTSLDQTLLLSLEDEAHWMIDTDQVKGDTEVPDFLSYVDSAALRKELPAEVTIIEAQGN